MRRDFRNVGVGVVILGWATANLSAQVPDLPVFSLWAVEVTDGMGGPNKCTSCPTQHVPAGQMAPGDVVRIEAYVSNWDAEPELGRCDGDPLQGQNQPCNSIGASCPGMHCGNNGNACATDVNCGGAACIQNTCGFFPRVGAYSVTVLGSSLSSGDAGQLVPHQISCNPADCVALADGTCPCAQFHVTPSDCTCTSAVCSASTNLCSSRGSVFIEFNRPDSLFFGSSSDGIISLGFDNTIEFHSYLLNPVVDGVVDNGTLRNVGSAFLAAGPDADGTFTITFWKNPKATFVVASTLETLVDHIYQDLIIEIEPCCAALDCDDNNLCTTDERDCNDLTCQTCVHTPLTCDPGMLCNPVNGQCEVPPDDDGDGVPNHVDVCPGVDDDIFAPGCVAAIPTVSHWGLVVLALLIAVVGKVQFGRTVKCVSADH